MLGSLAPLAGGGEVGHLDGGGSAPDGRTSQVFGCRLVMLVQTGAAGIGLHPGQKNRTKGITGQTRLKITSTHLP